MRQKLYNYVIENIKTYPKNKIMSYLLKNKINCNCLGEEYKDLLLKKSMIVQEAVRELSDLQRTEKQQWITSFLAVKQLWDKNEVKYLFHKSCGEFPFLSDNLDVLVLSKDYRLAHKLLIDSGYIELRNIQEPHKKFYRKIGGESFHVPIHLHERVCWSVPYDDIDHMWEFCQTSNLDEGVVFPSYEDAFVTTIAHAFIEDHVFKIGDLIKIAMCLENALNWDYIHENVRKNHWVSAFGVALSCLNYLTSKTINEDLIPSSILNHYHSLLAKRFNHLSMLAFQKKPIKFPYQLSHLRVRIYSSLRFINDSKLGSKTFNAICAVLFLVDGIINLKLKYRNQPSYLLTISGGDGSGKTFHKDYLLGVLKNFGLENRVVWMRYGSMTTTRFVNSLRKKLRGSPPQDLSSQRRVSTTKTGSIIWLGLNIFDLVLVSLRYRAALVLEKKIYIFDRNLLDFLVDYSVSTEKALPEWLVKLLVLIFPKTNYGTFLVGGASPVTSELQNENPILQQQYYKLYQRYFPKIIRVGNNLNYESCDAIATHILRDIFARYPEKYSGYYTTSMKYK